MIVFFCRKESSVYRKLLDITNNFDKDSEFNLKKKSSPITNEPIIIYLNFNSDKDLPHNQFRQLTKLLSVE